jgi:hypothetical protein
LGLKITHLPLITHTGSFLFSFLPLPQPLYHAQAQPAGGGGAPARRRDRRRRSSCAQARPAAGELPRTRAAGSAEIPRAGTTSGGGALARARPTAAELPRARPSGGGRALTCAGLAAEELPRACVVGGGEDPSRARVEQRCWSLRAGPCRPMPHHWNA